MKRFLALALVVGSCASAHAAGTWKDRAYDATYTYSTAQGTGDYRMAADGKGKMLVETKMPNMNSVTIVDAPGRVTYMISNMGGQQTAMKMPYKEDAAPASTDAAMKQLNARSLGVKLVDGHPSQGWTYTQSGYTTESWIGKDIDMMVRSSTTGPNMKTSMVLKNFKNGGPAASAFQIPAGVKVVDMSQMQQMYGGGKTAGQ
jgi:hypothetical protein